MCSHGQAAVNGARRMFVNGRIHVADRGDVISVLSTVGDGRAFDESNALVEQGCITGGTYIVRAGVGQPQQIVREMGSHTGAQWGVPPVLYVALFELA